MYAHLRNYQNLSAKYRKLSLVEYKKLRTFVAVFPAAPYERGRYFSLMTHQVVDIRHISKTFSGQQVLHDVSLQVSEGESVGLLGPNGAGKSTLMKILIGILSADKAQSNGESAIVQCPERIGYLSEQNPLYQEMYVREYLLFMARFSHSESEVEELIDRVGLRAEVHKHIRVLSKGYRQRVGLATALMGNPQLLILDEPTTGLDPNQLEDIRHVVRETRKKCPIILSTHILQEVKEMCTRVVILDHGHIRADRPIEDIPDLEQLFHDTTN